MEQGMKRYLEEMVRGFHKFQQRILSEVTGALLRNGEVRSFGIAQRLSAATGAKLPSALTRFYRFLANSRIDDWQLCERVFRALDRPGQRMLVALDWTEWHEPLRMLLASVIVGKRAIPGASACFAKDDIPRSQNSRENTFLKMVCAVLDRLKIRAIFFSGPGLPAGEFYQVIVGTGRARLCGAADGEGKSRGRGLSGFVVGVWVNGGPGGGFGLGFAETRRRGEGARARNLGEGTAGTVVAGDQSGGAPPGSLQFI